MHGARVKAVLAVAAGRRGNDTTSHIISRFNRLQAKADTKADGHHGIMAMFVTTAPLEFATKRVGAEFLAVRLVHLVSVVCRL